MKLTQRVNVKSKLRPRPDPIAESLRNVQAFHDAIIGIVEEQGVRHALHFIGNLVEDGVLPAIDGKYIKAKIRKRGKATVT